MSALAIRAGKKLVVGEKTIVTPAARDLGEEQQGVRPGRLAALTPCTEWLQLLRLFDLR